MTDELPAFVTLTGAARELHVCIRTLKVRVASGEVTPDAVLVEGTGKPGSLIFRAESLPSIAAKLAPKPKRP